MTGTRSVSEMVLKPCPFCGGEADVEYDGGSSAGALCRNDACPVKPETRSFFTPDEAIAAWNTRASSQAQSDDVVERAIRELKERSHDRQ